MNTTKPDLDRRKILQSATISPLLLSLWPGLGNTDSSNPIVRPIPSSGEQLAIIGVGTSRTFEVSSSESALAPLVEVMQAFFDRGGQLIDSSPMYGSAESVTGKLLQRVKNHDRLFAATKVWTNGKQNGIAQMQQSMQRMGVERFDLMQIHNLRDWRVHLETLLEWKAEGLVRYIGITTSHGRYHHELEEILQQQPLDFVQLSYNIIDRAVEDRLLPIAAERGIATLINRPYQRGSLFRRVKGQALPGWAAEIDCASWGQFFLKFIAGHPGVTCIIPATSKLKHMVDNMGANFGPVPSSSMRRKMIATVEAL